MTNKYKHLPLIAIILLLSPLAVTRYDTAASAQNADYATVQNSFYESLERKSNLEDVISGGKILRLKAAEENPTEEVPEENQPGIPDTEWQRSWSEGEIIQLGYLPGEVIVQFKRSAIDLQSTEGKTATERFAREKSPAAATFALQRMEQKGELELQSIDQEKIQLLRDTFLQVKEYVEFANIAVLKIGIDTSAQEVAEFFAADPNVESIMPNYVFEFSSDDLAAGTAIPQEEEESGTDGLQSAADEPAEKPQTGNIQLQNAVDDDEIIVAVMDSGVAYEHEYLKNNLWDGSTGCKDVNGNAIPGGCPFHGYDFVNDDLDPVDDNGHGTKVSGAVPPPDGVSRRAPRPHRFAP